VRLSPTLQGGGGETLIVKLGEAVVTGVGEGAGAVTCGEQQQQ